MSNNIDAKRNKLKWVLVILFLISFIGTIYFIVYNAPKSNTGLAILFYVVAFSSLIVLIVYCRHNVKRQLIEGFSLSNRKKTIWAFIVLCICGTIIDFISKYIGGQKGFTIGLILGLIFFVTFFIVFSKRKE